MEPTTTKENHHAIFLPLPLQGHINPFVQLALTLASSKGFTITFLVFESVHHELTKARISTGPCSGDIFEEARAGPDPLDIRYRVLSDGLPLEFDRMGRFEDYVDWFMNGSMGEKLGEAVEEIVKKGSKPPPNVFVVDTFYPWGSKIAKRFGLFHASFWTQPALVFNLYYHAHLLTDHGHFGCPDPREDSIDYIPGVTSIEPKDLSSYLQSKSSSKNMQKLISRAFQDVIFADCVLCNSIQDLEQHTISTLKNLVPTFYPIGPILRTKSILNTVHTSLLGESRCTNWLDQKVNGSILYVSFGSLASFSKDNLIEFAHGLKASNVGFVWVLRPLTVLHETEVDEMLPEGFKEGTHNRGIIVSWTSQMEILSHPAIAGFVTHCGWNSVLESIWNRIPMMCFPVFGDQTTIRKLVVDDWRIGDDLCCGKTMQREDIATRIQKFMSQKPRDEFCKNTKEVHKLLENALGVDGSSMGNIDIFTKHLEKLQL